MSTYISREYNKLNYSWQYPVLHIEARRCRRHVPSDAVMAEISVFGGYYGGIWHQFLAVAEILLLSASKQE